MQQMLPASAVYHIALAVRILSPLDVAALRSALQAIGESLRTVIAMDPSGELTQRVAASCAVAFEVVETSGLARDEIDARAIAAYRQPFGLAAGPLFRSHLFTDGGQDHLLLVNVHHLVFDVLSLVVIFTELLEIYGGTSSPRPPKCGFREFAEWQAQMLAGPEGESHLAYWREQLAGAPPVLELPVDRPRPTHANGLGGSVDSRWKPT